MAIFESRCVARPGLHRRCDKANITNPNNVRDGHAAGTHGPFADSLQRRLAALQHNIEWRALGTQQTDTMLKLLQFLLAKARADIVVTRQCACLETQHLGQSARTGNAAGTVIPQKDAVRRGPQDFSGASGRGIGAASLGRGIPRTAAKHQRGRHKHDRGADGTDE